MDWWIGGVEACSLGVGGLQVNSSTRDRDGSADHNFILILIIEPAEREPRRAPKGGYMPAFKAARLDLVMQDAMLPRLRKKQQ